ncbi:hypothetical protein IMF27_28125 [Pseudomonas sp. PCH199]|uniref:hypothetical protein n=1 Tax=unclassified Pseudomonas TaxID=196821 RepID=UPI000BC7D641|nr:MULTISPECIES: hypothetical protein [unclassified Pseudomonas]MCW8278904.1 hypothetical protein [Pseudomonas sp. PCH199]PAM79859.1 hypothetical protein CES87_28765 [Pseudomonas sp. ERMR1:02]
MIVNDNAGSLTPNGVLSFIASRLAPTEILDLLWLLILIWLLIFRPFGRPSVGVHQGLGAQRRAAKPHTSRGGAAKQTGGDAP